MTYTTSNRATIKARIADLNVKAQTADANMRAALRRFNLWKAYAWRRERDRYNAEAKRLIQALNQPTSDNATSTSTTAATQPTPRSLGPERQRRLHQLNHYEIPHAEKMLAEYRRYNNAQKIAEWEQKLRVLNTERLRLSGASGNSGGDNDQPARTLTPAQQRRLNQLDNYEIPHAEKMLTEYRRYNNAQKIAEWESKLRNLQTERAGIASSGNATQPVTPTPPQPPEDTGRDTTSGNFITRTGDAFLAANPGNDQDVAHNAILVELLNGKYSEANVALNDPFARAYREARRNYSSALHWIRNQGQLQTLLNTFPPAGSLEQSRFPGLRLDGKRGGQTFFIRDFMQFKSAGNASLANMIIIDNAINAGFARDFDRMASRINEYLRSRGERRRQVRGFRDMAHRDALQLIPETENGLDRFAGATMRDVSVSGNVIYSDGALQGIFATDGLFKNLHIRNNHVQIGGRHTIAISGMLSGSIMGNTDINGNPLPASKIQLYPLRLGGGANIYILGFRNQPGLNRSNVNYYNYEDIPGVAPESDQRRKVTNPRGAYFRDVDMYALKKRLAANPPPRSSSGWDNWVSFWQNTMAELVRQGQATRVTP